MLLDIILQRVYSTGTEDKEDKKDTDDFFSFGWASAVLFRPEEN